eukprot:7094066-Pyramimonas_sp.AAC.1
MPTLESNYQLYSILRHRGYRNRPLLDNNRRAMTRTRGVTPRRSRVGHVNPRQPEIVRAIGYDMIEFFESCMTLYAQLTDADPATYPAAGAPLGPELTD